MTIKEFIQINRQEFEILDLEILLSFMLKKTTEFLFLNQDFKLNNQNILDLNNFLIKRRVGYSIAQLIGEKEFYGRIFIVNKNTLIPRPETENLIDEVLKILKDGDVILDVGVGSGIIPITLGLEKKDLKIVAVDISKLALSVAKKNTEKYGLGINFLESDLLSAFKEKVFFNVITANLPYVEDSYKNLSILKDPDLALYSGVDGLDHYRRLFLELKKGIVDFKYLFLEIADFQVDGIRQIYKSIGSVEFIKDYSGKNRVAKIVKED